MYTADELKAYLGAGAVSAAETTVLTDIEARACELVERATGRVWNSSGSATLVLDGSGDEFAFVGLDVAALTSVSVRSEVSADWTVLDTDAYEFTAHKSKIVRVDGDVWPEGRSLVRVVCTRGYSDPDDVPGPIRQLVLDLTNWQFRAGRMLSLEDKGSPDVAKVPGWERTINLYRAPMYG